MKKIVLFLMLLLSSILPTNISAQGIENYSTDKLIRIFCNDGESHDFNSSQIDSLTVSNGKQLFWQDGDFHSFDLAAIDSVWYMSPTLRVSANDMNFGKVAVGNTITQKLVLTNTGNYPEVYMVYSKGIFTVENSGQYVKLQPGESKSLEFSFTPSKTELFSSYGLLTSSAVIDGMISIPLIGEGVASDEEEGTYDVEPIGSDVEIEVPNDASLEGLNLKIVNAFGEFPIDMQSSAKRRGRVVAKDGEYYEHDWLNTAFYVSPYFMQAHFITDHLGNPFLFKVTTPSDYRVGKPTTKITVEDTAISLLMLDALMLTSDEAEYKNMVWIIKHLDSYPNYLKQVTEEYNRSLRNGYCPSYSDIDPKEVIHELFAKYRDNSWVPKNGIEVNVNKRNGSEVNFSIVNNQKRLLHIYTSKLLMSDSNLIPVETADDVVTLSDLLQHLIEKLLDKYGVSDHKELLNTVLQQYGVSSIDDLAKIAENDENLQIILDDLDELEELQPLKDWMNDIAAEIGITGIGGDIFEYGIPLPIVFESGKADYWKIVKGSLQGDDSSIFQVKLDNLNYNLEGYNKLVVDTYGIGIFNKPWDEYTNKEKFRIIIALIHGCYKDVIRPAIELGGAIKDVANAAGSNDFKYDLRFGKRKYPEAALITKFTHDFMSNTDNLKTLAQDIKNKDLWGLVQHLCVFSCKILLKEDSGTDAESKRTYSNLMYNIFKKIYFGTYGRGRIADNKRQAYKDVMNNITHLASTNFVGKTINLMDKTMDFAGAIVAFASCDVQTSFVIDANSEPNVTIVSPTVCYQSFDITAKLEWKVDKASAGYGDWLSDVVVYRKTPVGYESSIVASNISGDSYDLNIRNIPGIEWTSDVDFQIVVHHKDNPNMIYARSEITDLASIVPPGKFEFIDMGLTSGTLWAVCNIGADVSTANGNYFAWGERKGFNEGKTTFSWQNYSLCRGASNTLTKYCSKSSYGANGYTDDLVQLTPYDDYVSCTYSYPYCIPTKEDWDELIRECYWSKLYNGVLVKSKKNGNVIFLPCAGYRQGVNLYDEGSEGYYWTSSLDVNSPDDAWFVYIGNGKANDYDYYRCSGRSIRPIMRNVTGGSAAKPMAPAMKQDSQPVEKAIEGGMVVKTMSGAAH